MKHYYHFTLLALFSVMMLVSCKKEDLTPAYIELTLEDMQNTIDMTNFNTDRTTPIYEPEKLEAISQLNFTNAKVTVNGTDLGVWELPCKIPVLDAFSDSVTIKVIPCFRKDGMYNTITGYPFVNIVSQYIKLTKEEVFTFKNNPIRYTYYKKTQFPIVEAFDGSSTEFSSSDTSAGSANFSAVHFENRNVGQIALTKADSSFEVLSKEISVRYYNIYAYLELTYKIDKDVHISMLMDNANGTPTQYPIASISGGNVNGEWKTILIDLSSTIAKVRTSYYKDVQIVLSGSSDDSSSANFYFDNIKFVYLEE